MAGLHVGGGGATIFGGASSSYRPKPAPTVPAAPAAAGIALPQSRGSDLNLSAFEKMLESMKGMSGNTYNNTTNFAAPTADPSASSPARDPLNQEGSAVGTDLDAMQALITESLGGIGDATNPGYSEDTYKSVGESQGQGQGFIPRSMRALREAAGARLY